MQALPPHRTLGKEIAKFRSRRPPAGAKRISGVAGNASIADGWSKSPFANRRENPVRTKNADQYHNVLSIFTRTCSRVLPVCGYYKRSTAYTSMRGMATEPRCRRKATNYESSI